VNLTPKENHNGHLQGATTYVCILLLLYGAFQKEFTKLFLFQMVANGTCGDVRILLGMMLHMLVTCNAMSHFEVTESNLDDKFLLQTIGIVWSQLQTNKILLDKCWYIGYIYIIAYMTLYRLWMWGLILGCCLL
jgi:hypothetical protein